PLPFPESREPHPHPALSPLVYAMVTSTTSRRGSVRSREEATVNQYPATTTFLQHLRTPAGRFVLRRAATAPEWGDATAHDDFCPNDPELYALCSLAERVPAAQQARVLFQVLRQSRAGLSPAVRHVLDRVTARLLATLPAEQVLTVFLALRRVRANHKHTTRAILRYLLNHPRLEELAAAPPPALVACPQHHLATHVPPAA